VRVPSGVIEGERTYGSAGLLGRIQSAHAASLLTTVTPAVAAAKARPRVFHATFNKLMVSVMVLASVGTLASGTLASFNAQTVNGGNTFQDGSVLMTNVAGSVISGSNCTTATNNGTCATLFGAGNTGNLKPSTTDISNTVTITYSGTITTADFRLWAANYTAKTASSTAQCTAPASGAGNPGTAMDLLVTVGAGTLLFPAQNTTTSAAIANGAAVTTITVNATTAALANGAEILLYNAGTYQQFTTSGAVALGATSIPVVSQTANAAYGIGSQVAPQGTLDAFATAYTGAGNGLQLKGGTNGAGALGIWAAGDNSIFNIKVHLDQAANNTFQGCQSQSDLVWYASS
jgi:hypothetical protein